MQTSLRICVTGLAITYPFGGVFWDYLQYLLGFYRLGHEVLYLEDPATWCYVPNLGTFVEDGSRNASNFAREIKALEPKLADHWFYRDVTGKTYGRTWNKVVQFCQDADLFINISASCWMREEYFAAHKVAFIDSDPMYTQSSVPGYLVDSIDDHARSQVDMIRKHDVFFTFAENIDGLDCRVPTELFRWNPTRQPIVLDCFDSRAIPVSSRRKLMTTVASWEPSYKPLVVNGIAYQGKSAEFERFIDLPSHSALPLELAMSGRAPADRLRSYGWILRDPLEVSYDPWVYRDYLAHSMGEWSVAKNAYVASRSGWFSCRTACYLALGVPTVVQDTEFSVALPTGEGLFGFNTMEEASNAIAEIASDPGKHAKKAREIAIDFFNSRVVLNDLLDQIFSTS